MGILDILKRKNTTRIPNCKIEKDESSGTIKITCNAKKILDDTTIQAERPVQLAIQGGQLYTIDDGGLEENEVFHIQAYVKKAFGKK